MEDMNNAECANFDNVAPDAEHINQQDSTVKDKPSELFGCFDPGKNKQHNQYDLLDDIRIFPRSSDQEEQQKLMSTFLLNQNFAFRIGMIHINLVNLHFTEMTLVSLT